MDKDVTELEFDADNSEEYKMEEIWDSAIYVRKLESHLLGLYYLIA